jgi:hypothetical protein
MKLKLLLSLMTSFMVQAQDRNRAMRRNEISDNLDLRAVADILETKKS